MISKSLWTVPAIFATVLAATSAGREPRPIVIDGRFGDWAGLPAAWDDPVDARGSAVDLGLIKAGHDEDAIFLLIDLGRSVNAEALAGTLSLLFDADAKPETGWSEAGLMGSDLVVDLSPPYGVGGAPPGLGVGVRRGAHPDRTGVAGSSALIERVDGYDVGFVYAPKYRSRWIELRLDRRSPSGGTGPFRAESYTAKVVFRGPRGEPLDEAGPFVYDLRPDVPRRTRPAGESDPLARPPDAPLRVMSWNVSGRNLLERTDVFRRLISAARPDLLLLDEAPADLSPGEIRALLPALPTKEGSGWEVIYGQAGGRQRGVIASRVGRLAPLPRLERVEYPRDLTERLEGTRPLGFGGTDDGIPTLGAVVELPEGRLLVSTSDLQCCGNGSDTPEELIRLAEAESIGTAIRKAMSGGEGGVDAVLVTGDFNLVGSRRPLDLLLRGLDTDGSNLTDAHPLDLAALTDATWSGARAVRAFTPGRLDCFLYSDSALRLEQAFVLSTGDLPARWLQAHGLRADDSDHASDHRPIVADLSWIEPEPEPRRRRP